MEEIILDGETLDLDKIVKISRHRFPVKIDERCIEKINRCRDTVERLVRDKKVVYGLTTGFASFKNVAINEDQTEELQKNLIESHAVGVGKPFDEEIVRAAIVVRINSLIKGCSGIRAKVLNTLIEMLNKQVYPYVPEQGSVGSSGDLAPLSHTMLVLMGKGRAFYEGKVIDGQEAMRIANIQPITLKSKEGLALNNGTAFMTGIGALALFDSINLIKTSDISLALTMEAIEGIISPYEERIHLARPHQGQIDCASNIRRMCNGSKAIKTQKESERIQDSYSIRCSPQVHGAVRGTIDYVKKVIEIEMNSITDNPLIFEDEALSGGNFHGEPIAIAMDCLGIAISEIASISERRISKMVDPSTSNGLPIFLIKKEKGGLNSGFMMPQYTAAALVSENKVLAHPASVDSIPTSAGQEDHVSMGTIASRKARQIIENVKNVLAIELINATQGVDLRENGVEKLSFANRITYNLIRDKVKYYEEDRPHYTDIEEINNLIQKETLVNQMENAISKLG